MRMAIGGGLAAAMVLAGCGNFLAPVKDGPKTRELRAKVRDFKEGNPTSPEGTHPHFNQGVASCEAHLQGVNTVEEGISTSGAADASFPGDERSPVLAPLGGMPANVSRCFEPAARFTDWFEDKGTDVNRSFYFNLVFAQDENTGLWEFRDERFFPLDRGEGSRKASANAAEPFGNLQTGVKDGVELSVHDYGFTLEFHAMFIYSQGTGQKLSVRGDDDVWVFMNGKRVIDLGGMHAVESDSVHLDQLAGRLGLSDKGQYPLDFFFAERSTASSKLAIVTNLQLTPYKP